MLRAAQSSTLGPEGRHRPAAPAVTRGCESVAAASRTVLHGAGARGSTAGWPTGRRPMGACLRAEHPVGGAAHPGRATVEDVRVDHRRAQVPMPEQLQDGADVLPVFQQVRRERVRGPGRRATEPRPPAPPDRGTGAHIGPGSGWTATFPSTAGNLADDEHGGAPTALRQRHIRDGSARARADYGAASGCDGQLTRSALVRQVSRSIQR